ncbi:MAG: radical SAM protein [Deltaproteobacteria bacterium]|nr:radical SAM protein [Deltaproteobacteria bacterium]
MFEYDMPLYRPPSEAYSLIFQATLGCTHNRCAFCVAYQSKHFRVRPEKELFREIDEAAREMPDTRRVFLADGDAMALAPQRMLRILGRLYDKFPDLERVTSYASPQNLLHHSVKDMQAVHQAGMSMLYFGLESGDDEVLRRIDKGATCDEMVEACKRAHQAGFDLSITVILGAAGPKGSKRHAIATAKALDRIRPKYASALTLMTAPRSPSYEEAYGDPDWRMLDQVEILKECRVLIDNMQADGIIFRSNHASNYLALKGDLQKDKLRLLETIDKTLSDPDSPLLRPEYLRAL